MATTESVRQEEKDLDDKMGDHHSETRDHVTTMTRVYKQMEKGKNDEIEQCRAEVEEQEEEKKTLQNEI